MPKETGHKTTPKATQATPVRREVVAKLIPQGKPTTEKSREFCNTPGEGH